MLLMDVASVTNLIIILLLILTCPLVSRAYDTSVACLMVSGTCDSGITCLVVLGACDATTYKCMSSINGSLEKYQEIDQFYTLSLYL